MTTSTPPQVEDPYAVPCTLCGAVLRICDYDYWESLEEGADPIVCSGPECRRKVLMRGMFTAMRVVRVALKMQRQGIKG